METQTNAVQIERSNEEQSEVHSTDRFKALGIIDDVAGSHIKASYAFRIGGWLNARLIGLAASAIRRLEGEGFEVTKLDAQTVRDCLLGPDGDNDFVTEAQATHALLNRIAGWGEPPKIDDTLKFMTRPGKESRISRELLVAALQMRGKRAPKNVEERVDQLLKLDEARERAAARALADAGPNVLWTVEHIFGDYTDAENALDNMSDDGVEALDAKLLTATKQMADEAMLNAVKGIGDWSLGDVRILDDVTDELMNL